MSSSIKAVCECGTRTQYGKCPTCDALRRPAQRLRHVEMVVRKRVEKSNVQFGLNRKAVIEASVRIDPRLAKRVEEARQRVLRGQRKIPLKRKNG